MHRDPSAINRAYWEMRASSERQHGRGMLSLNSGATAVRALPTILGPNPAT